MERKSCEEFIEFRSIVRMIGWFDSTFDKQITLTFVMYHANIGGMQ